MASILALTGCRLDKHSIRVEPELLLTSNGVPFTAPAHYPAFSWDTVPVYMMFADGARLLKDAEVRKIASETGFICIEKNHGLKPLGDAVLGLEHETRAFKAVNPDTVVLGYLNSAWSYPFTRYTEMFTPEEIDQHPDKKAFLLTDPETGELHNQGRQYCLNILNPDMRAWWSDAAADMVRVGDADGIFIDQMHGFGWLQGRDKKDAVAAGVADMMRQLKDKIGPDKIFLANNGAHIPEIFDIADAFMFEHYKREATHTKEKILRDWALMEKIADAGKLCVYRFGVQLDAGEDRKALSPEDFAALSREQVEMYLALYLIGAQPYSYFQWNWGWKLSTGPLEHYPEFHKPLGKPLGKYTRVHPEQWEFTRDFEHARVWVDTEKWQARIEWE